MSDFDALWAAVMAYPNDSAPKLILADYLQELGVEPLLERRLRGNGFIVASLKCKYKQAKRRSKAILETLRKGNRTMYANGGTFKGRIVKWGLTKSKTKGTEQFFVNFTLLAQVQDGEEVHCPTSDQTIYRPITDNTIDYIVEDLKNLGFTGTDFTMLEPESPNAHDFNGVEFLARCTHEEYQGKTQERWSFAWGGGEAPKLESSAISKLNQRFGAKLKQAMGNGAKPANAQPAPRPAQAKSTSEQLEEIL